MGEHGTWTDLLYELPGMRNLHDYAGQYLTRKTKIAPFAETHFTLTHVLVTMCVLMFILYGALQFRAGLATADGGLVPGFVTPNDTLKTNVGIALLVFVLTHYYGIKEHGALNYFKHFMGPSPWLAPLIFPIELISHLARPLSLSVRLLGNMMADHKVVMSFFALVPILVPIPFMLLGLLVCLIQALVFCTLTMVYIGMAMEHEEH